MGINTEMYKLLSYLQSHQQLDGKKSVMELGAQVISAHRDSLRTVQQHLGKAHLSPPSVAIELYQQFGLADYCCVDAGGSATTNKIIADLNKPLQNQWKDFRTFDVVTNIGTSEHCFDQVSVFRNIHDLTAVGGLMIHQLCTQGLVNHGYYNYHPRFIYEMAQANAYEIVKMWFTVDFTSDLIEYSLDDFYLHDDRDVMIYVVLKKKHDRSFRLPFDSLFDNENQIEDYKEGQGIKDKEFDAYIKSTWSNATAADAFRRKPSSRLLKKAVRDTKRKSYEFKTGLVRFIKKYVLQKNLNP